MPGCCHNWRDQGQLSRLRKDALDPKTMFSMFCECLLLLATASLNYMCLMTYSIFNHRLILVIKSDCSFKSDQQVEPKCTILTQPPAQLGAELSSKFWGFIPIHEVKMLSSMKNPDIKYRQTVQIWIQLIHRCMFIGSVWRYIHFVFICLICKIDLLPPVLLIKHERFTSNESVDIIQK